MHVDGTDLVFSERIWVRVEELSKQSLTMAYQYCRGNDLLANTAETKKIHFQIRTDPTGTREIIPENNAKLLGITIDANLTLTPHIDNTVYEKNILWAICGEDSNK